jgi:phosphinothricin acetyltransferase
VLLVTRSGLGIRAAEPADGAAIARIYNAGLEERIATFETRPRVAEEFADRIAALPPEHAFLVAGSGGRVVGATWYGAYSTRECYRGVGDYSVYVDREARGHGAGRQLLAARIEAARERDCWKLVGRIFPANEPSLRLAERVGFRQVGVHRRHARLDGQWHDVVVVERLIEPGLRAARDADWPGIAALIEGAGLTPSGARDHLDSFLIAVSGPRIVGVAGLELYGAAALLRSVVVDQAERGTGLGTRLVEAALDLARDRGAATVALLTLDAADYFTRFGFVRVPAAQVPDPVRQSSQFQGACPASAIAMLKPAPLPSPTTGENR